MASPVSRVERAAVIGSAVLFAVNVATTARWANVPGGMRGWRWPLIALAIVGAVLPAVRANAAPGSARWLSRVLLWTGPLVLAGDFLIDWLPLHTWNLIPFADDWPPRFSSTVEGIALLRRGAFGGWQWNLMGGYSIATDITQNLAVLGALPMTLFGDRIGFHLLHLVLFLLVPLIVYLDLRGAREASAAVGLAAWSACVFAWGMIRNGDTNSLAGVVCVLAVLAASHRARLGRPFGFTALVSALTLTAYSHLGFLAYAVGLLGVEAVYYRDGRMLGRSALASALALAASLPVTYEIVRYPDQFNFNNVLYERQPVDWLSVARRVFYNAQILVSPHRWFSDTTKLFMPVVLFAAWKRDGRAGFYAWAALAVVGLTLLNVPEAGYVFQRPAHLLIVFTPIVLAWFIVSRASGTLQGASLAALTVLTLPIAGGFDVHHEASVETFVPRLVARMKTASGPMVLLENNPHREVSVPPERSEKSLYGTHYEALVPEAIGRRLYAAYWDGWMFTPFRGEMVAGGAWQGHLLRPGDRDAFIHELRRWGIHDLFVWSNAAKQALSAWPELRTTWSDGPWRQFELTDTPPDLRTVVTTHGQGELAAYDALGGRVHLSGVEKGDPIVVRTHFHPAWHATGPEGAVALRDAAGQLGFSAPASGEYDIVLRYPSRRGLLLMAALVLALVAAADWRRTRRAPPR